MEIQEHLTNYEILKDIVRGVSSKHFNMQDNIKVKDHKEQQKIYEW